MADDDARDERLGRLLEVEPLDELARRRLVSTAMRASARRKTGSPCSRSRFAAAASVVVIVVAGGIGYLALRGNDSTAPSASSQRPKASAADDRLRDRRRRGDVGSAAGQRGRLRAASAAVPRATSATSAISTSPRTSTGLRDSTQRVLRHPPGSGSARRPQRVTRHAVARTGLCERAARGHRSSRSAPGTSAPATRSWCETTLADGTTSLDAVVTHPCEVRPLD